MPIYFVKPVPRPAIWGGTLLRDYFQHPEFPKGTGQAWAFSAQESASTEIENGPYQGKTLRWLWQEHPELFKSAAPCFPVIISLVAPEDDLSIQIHPNQQIAAQSGYPTGKNEAWYFLQTPPGAAIVYGQQAQSEAVLRRHIQQEAWGDLLLRLPVTAGDFVYLPAGMLHALSKGSIVYEIQQATDVTYRFFDYHRKDEQGKERPLQVEEAIACVDYTLSQAQAHPKAHTQKLVQGELTTYVRNDSFCVKKLAVRGAQPFGGQGYQLLTVVRGHGTADGISTRIGRSFLLPAENTCLLEGDMDCMITCEA